MGNWIVLAFGIPSIFENRKDRSISRRNNKNERIHPILGPKQENETPAHLVVGLLLVVGPATLLATSTTS